MHAVYESREIVSEVADDFNRALSGELAFETTSEPIELINQSLIWFVEAINEKLHQNVTWNQLAITRRHLAAKPELFEKAFTYLTTAQEHPEILNTSITAQNKATYRPLLQWIGGYLVAKISSTIWFDEIFRRIDLHDGDKNLVVINGLRYPSDAAVVRAHGGIILEIQRPLESEQDPRDITEVNRGDIKPDIVLLNNGSINELEAIAAKLWADLSISSYQKQYSAS